VTADLDHQFTKGPRMPQKYSANKTPERQ